MTRAWKIALILAVIVLVVFSVSLGWGAPQRTAEGPTIVLHGDKAPVFSANDRKLIEAYYLHLLGTLAPGSINRSNFDLGVEKSLVAGSHVPSQFEKEMMPLPAELEAKLTPLTGDYVRYKLGPHVVLVKKADLTIADIIKNVGMK
jgi:hypothetical protein